MDLYVPPCCIHLQLPDIIKSGTPVSTFYSQGDWGFPKLSHAVENLVDSHKGDVCTVLVMSDLTQDTIRYIERELKMGWSKAMIIVTFTDRTDLLKSQLSATALDSIYYCPNRREVANSNLWLRHNNQASMFIMGPITPTDAGTHSFSAYTAYYTTHSSFLTSPSSFPDASPDLAHATPPSTKACSSSPAASSTLPPALRQVFSPWRSMLRLHATIRGQSPIFTPWLK